MAHTERYKRVRRRLYDQDPHCRQCGVRMIPPEQVPGYSEGKIKFTPDNMCTYEHVHSRLNPYRLINIQNKNTIICAKCNQLNAKIDEEIYLGLEGKRKASSHE